MELNSTALFTYRPKKQYWGISDYYTQLKFDQHYNQSISGCGWTCDHGMIDGLTVKNVVTSWLSHSVQVHSALIIRFEQQSIKQTFIISEGAERWVLFVFIFNLEQIGLLKSLAHFLWKENHWFKYWAFGETSAGQQSNQTTDQTINNNSSDTSQCIKYNINQQVDISSTRCLTLTSILKGQSESNWWNQVKPLQIHHTATWGR